MKIVLLQVRPNFPLTKIMSHQTPLIWDASSTRVYRILAPTVIALRQIQWNWGSLSDNRECCAIQGTYLHFLNSHKSDLEYISVFVLVILETVVGVMNYNLFQSSETSGGVQLNF